MGTTEERIENLLDNQEGWAELKRNILNDLITFGKVSVTFLYDEKEDSLIIEFNDFKLPFIYKRRESLLSFWDWYCKEGDVDSKYTKEEMIEAFLKTI